MDKGMSNLLQWSIENSANAQPTDGSAQSTSSTKEPRGLTQDALRALMGGPSDADLMKQAMTVIVHPEAELEDKLTAFDNFEQLIENLDNANNMEPLGLWSPLLTQLNNAQAEIRKMAAWCVGTAVQNNEKCQQHLLSIGGVTKISKMAVDDQDAAARRKAVYALSSSVRNFQPGMNEALKTLPTNITGPDHVSASDMDVIDAIMAKLRE
ncbi:hsp70 nucleotide exchange factor fes1 [Neophaeococcomyces mojaviensis]|uniref:Hsp70 nucleotide exchange factor fes1 n=1 Tax=Neophaeococcomyces mojaviensis TaxID=3383035 RepID=A0ACC3AIX0_9EURO|nr:hsp70 nucleotide exchange factor fes1 [Knufia sp. JES_112]